MKSAYPITSLSFFGIALGFLAFAQSWRVAAEIWSLPIWLTEIITFFSLTIWSIIFVFQLYKFKNEGLVRALNNPMIALIPVTMLLVAMIIKTWSAEFARFFYFIALLGSISFSLLWVGRFWQGLYPLKSINATIYLPAVAQNFVAATACSSFGYFSLGSLFFGAGFFLWLAMESLVLQRMAIPEPLEEHLRPLQGIQIAPPVVGGIAYLSLRDGLPDLFAHMLLGYGLYQFILAVRLVPWTTKTSWSISYWAFSFGIMALTTMTLRFLQANSEELFWQCLGLVMFLVANVVFFLLIYNTITVLKRIHIKGH